jgi:phosphotriesterase-related protein
MSNCTPNRFTRREAIGLLGTATGLGLVTGLEQRIAAAAGQPRPFTSAQRLSFPKGAIVRTLLKDLPPDALANAATMFHEHLVGMNYSSPPPPPGQKPAPPSAGAERPEPVDLVVEELREAAGDGLGCIVDAAFRGRRRDSQIEALQAIAARAGVHVVMAGGYYRAPYPPGVAERSEDEIADELVADARAQRWGAFGEIGTSVEGIQPAEQKVLRAVSKAHLRTGVPIFSHTDHKGCARCALDQLDLFESAGVNPRTLCIGHLTDIRPEDDPGWQTHKAIARRGAFLGFDTVGRALALSNSVDIPEVHKVKMVLSALEAGYEDHVLLSADFANSPDLKANWGSGFSTVLVQFVPKLRYAGVDDKTIRKIVVDNPRRFLAHVPK